jgi:hypothetical protein
VVIGVHTPEFAFEKKLDNVKTALGDAEDRLSQSSTDNDYKIWRAFANNYWPALSISSMPRARSAITSSARAIMTARKR